jgi:hypothetical protein
MAKKSATYARVRGRVARRGATRGITMEAQNRTNVKCLRILTFCCGEGIMFAMDMQTYFSRVIEIWNTNAHLRLGQVYFNQLAAFRPELAEQVRGKYNLDPFYADSTNDKRIVNFIQFVVQNW